MQAKAPTLTFLIGRVEGSQADRACQRVEAGVGNLLTSLGIPGQVKVEADLEHEVFSINGSPIRFPSFLPHYTSQFILESAGSEASEVYSSFWEMAVLAALWFKPSVLFGSEQLEYYLHTLALDPDPGKTAFSEPDLLAIFHTLLDLKIGLQEREVIGQAIRSFVQKPQPNPLEIREHLIDELAADKLILRMPEAYFRGLLSHSSESNSFSEIRKRLFDRTGVIYPVFALQDAEDLGPYGFQVKINDMWAPPIMGIGPEELAIFRSVDELKAMQIDAKPWTGPFYGSQFAKVGQEAQAELDRQGIEPLDPFGLFASCFEEELGLSAACFITKSNVDDLLTRLSKMYPQLTWAATETLSLARITAVLRRLAAERVSLKNLRKVLENMLADVPLPETRLEVEEPEARNSELALPEPGGQMTDPENLLESVRTGLKDAIRRSLNIQHDTLPYFSLSDELEEELEKHFQAPHPLPPDLAQRVLNAFDRTFAHSGVQATVITGQHLRSPLADLLRVRFPHLRILVAQEVPNYLQTQHMGQVGGKQEDIPS